MGDSASSTRDCYVDSYGAIISTAKWLSEEALQIALKKKRNEKQRRKGKIFRFECRVPKNSKER